MCESCNKFTTEEAYSGTLAMDALVVKTTKVSEIGRIARSEIRLRNFLISKWKELSDKAIKKAVKEINGKTTQKKLNEVILKELDKWPKSVEKVFKKEINTTYRLGKIAGGKRANGKNVRTGYGNKEVKRIKKASDIDITFGPEDEKAIAALLEHQLFWIDDFVDETLSTLIAEIVRETMAEAGYGSELAGEILGERLEEAFGIIETPDGYSGSMEQYLESLAANTITVARAHGVLRSFLEMEVTTYQITNPSDRRTCERCAWLNGKVFSVEQGVRQMEAVLAAKDKDAVKSAHPWLTFKQLQQVSRSPGYISGRSGLADSQSLASAGVSLPPFHYRCRCSIDIASESTILEETT